MHKKCTSLFLHMKKKEVLCIFCLLFLTTVFGQNRFEKRYTIFNDVTTSQVYNQFKSVVQLPTGQYLACGYSGFYHPTIGGIFKIDAVSFLINNNGDSIKTIDYFKNDTSYYHQFNLGSNDILQHCILNSSGDVVAVGGLRGHGATHQFDVDAFLVKLNINGDTIVTKQISHPNDSALVPLYIIQTFDGNYLVTGKQFSFYNSKTVAFAMKVDPNFNVLWRKTYIQSNLSSTFWKALEAPDHGVFISGSEFDNNLSLSDPVLTKIDSVGNILWRNVYSSLPIDDGFSISKTKDGNYLFATTHTLSTMQPLDSTIYRFIKFNTNGTTISTKNYFHSYADGVFMNNTNNGNSVASLSMKTSSTLNVDIVVICMDTNGDSLWSRQFGGANDDFVWDISSTNDGGVILCGETYSNKLPHTNSNSWLLKLDSLGLLITGVKEESWVNTITMLEAYPNPFNSKCTIPIDIPKNIEKNGLGKSGNELQLYNLEGKIIQTIPLQKGKNEITINSEQLQSGTYLAVLVVNGYNVKAEKIVVLK